MKTEFYGTKDVAKLLEILPTTLSRAVWEGRIPAPEKGPGNSYIWAEADIQRAAREFGMKLQKRFNSV